MRFFPQGDEDIRQMLEVIGVESTTDLFRGIPQHLRHDDLLDLPAAHSELELGRKMRGMAALNATAVSHACFLGAGAYNHYIPAAVWQLLLRSEFYTSYTPYQPEVSQGTLQAIFEYQTLIAALTEMEISNASLYDGASSTAEGVLMAHRINRRPIIVTSAGVHPLYAEVVRSYVRNMGLEIVTVPVGADGRTDLARLEQALSAAGAEAGVAVVQSPNFFGAIEPLETIAGLVKPTGAMFQVVIAEPVSLGLLHGPGHYGADIAVGEAHALGAPLQFGGPFLGFMAAREKHLRQMPGRLAGEATDVDGRPGYVLTLSTREQHIRRQKATSNICTNQGLIALASAIHMSLLGKEGIREVAMQCHSKAVWARDQLARVPGCRVRFDSPIFNEFVLDLPIEAETACHRLLDKGFIAGLDLGRYHPEMKRSLLLCVTEMNTRGEIEKLAEGLRVVVR